MLLSEFKNIILFGAGLLAEYIYNQIENSEERVIGCIDTLKDFERKNEYFHNIKITNPEIYKKNIENYDTAVIICVYIKYLPEIAKRLIEEYGYKKDCIFLTNPYTSCRPCVISAEFAKDIRIPTDNMIYDEIRSLFDDDLSLKIYDKLRNSQTYDYLGDKYEIVAYVDIENLLWMSEDYWFNYGFNEEVGDTATVFDCGAYIGDSIAPICNAINYKYIDYHAFEPVEDSANEIEAHRNKYPCKNLNIHKVGIGRRSEEKNFVTLTNNSDGSYLSDIECDDIHTNSMIKVICLDEMESLIRGQLFIKMDIEGAELDALKGAENVLKKHRPFLAICVYHRKNDIVEIPKYLNELLENYHFYIRGGFHTILWGVPRELEERNN